MSKTVKVWVCGSELLPKDKSDALQVELKKRDITVAEFEEANVVIFVIGSDKDGKLREQAAKMDKRFFYLRPDEDSIFGSAMLGEAVLPKDAAQWAWSVINQPEKWYVHHFKHDI